MNGLRILLFVISAGLAGGCAVAASDSDRADEPASITGVVQDGDTLGFDVVSTGCTTKDSLEARVERLDEFTVALTLLRVKPDLCRRMPTTTRIDYSRESLGIADAAVVLRNPIVMLPGRR